MRKLTRREAMRWMAIQLGALVGGRLLAACGKRETPVQSISPPVKVAPTLTHPPRAPDTETPVVPEVSPTSEPTATPVSYPHLAVAIRGEPEALVRTVLASLGGMSQFVSPGDDVIVKPNICIDYHSYEYAATTNPWVVGALVKLCFESGAARVRVMDFPFGGTSQRAYVHSGIQEQVLSAGGLMEPISSFKFVSTDIPEGIDLKRYKIYEDILNADVVINVPIAKHHSLARLTLGMKNLMGTILNRPPMHQNLGQRLADLTSRVRPTLTVVDAVRVLRAHGPTGGNLNDVQKLDTVIASHDIVAADSFAATLFGLRPSDLSYVVAGEAMGLGRSDLENLSIEHIAVES
jgi:uncharacterized protein (DUF362 family)